MTEAYFLWPESSLFRALVSAPRFVPVAVVEKELRDMFPTGHPVLCSSGRAALALALIGSDVSRSDMVGVFPYASHCVLDAVSRTATPLTGTAATTASLRVVYHQWGFVQEPRLSPNTIEDCADTLCLPGAALFPGGGRFEVWSLPKILGTSSGGVLWCRDNETAEVIRCLRERRGGGLLPWAIRLLGKSYPKAHLYWQGAESDLGQVSLLQTGEILAAVLNWEVLVSDRLRRIDTIWSYSVGWLKEPSDRLPPVVPMPLDLPEELAYELGIASGYRMLERLDSSGVRFLEKVLPIPIHQDVTNSWLAGILKRVNDNKNKQYS